MIETNLVNEFNKSHNEEERLAARSGQIEFMTTMKYIHEYLKLGMRVLEIGAGTGRYSLALAAEGYRVDAVELAERNLEVFRSKLNTDIPINLFQEESKRQALEEAIRVTKRGGMIFAAYCMNEATILQRGCRAYRNYREEKLVMTIYRR